MMDKMREQFEAWYLAEYYEGDEQCGLEWLSTEPCGGYRYAEPAKQWKTWQASRAALVIQLPMPAKPVEPEDAFDDSWMDGYHAAVRTRNALISLIESAGIPTK